MNRGDFTKLANFSYKEVSDHYKLKSFNVADTEFEINKLSKRLFDMLQLLRDKINAPIIINSLTDGSHVAGSYHYKGQAIDMHCGDQRIHPNKIFQEALTLGFKGIGWYPEWRWPGFHLDIGDRKSTKVWRKVAGVYRPIIEAES